MRTVPFRAWGIALALAMTPSLAACATHPAVLPSGTAGLPMSATALPALGRVVIDVNGLFGGKPAGGTRQTLGYGLPAADFVVSKVRMSVRGPSLASTSLSEVAVTAGAAAGDSPKPPATISGTVAAGHNRVFLIEALDEAGNVLIRMRAAAEVPVNGTVALKLNFLDDAIARVIDRMIEDEVEYGVGAADGVLRGGDLVSPLRTFLTSLTGYDEATRTYTSSLAPQFVKPGVVARKVREEGAAWLAAPDASSLTTLTTPSENNTFTLAVADGLPIPDEFHPSSHRLSVIAPVAGGWGSHHRVPFDQGAGMNLSAVVPDLPPGRFTVVFFSYDTETELISKKNFYEVVVDEDTGVEFIKGAMPEGDCPGGECIDLGDLQCPDGECL